MNYNKVKDMVNKYFLNHKEVYKKKVDIKKHIAKTTNQIIYLYKLLYMIGMIVLFVSFIFIIIMTLCGVSSNYMIIPAGFVIFSSVILEVAYEGKVYNIPEKQPKSEEIMKKHRTYD